MLEDKNPNEAGRCHCGHKSTIYVQDALYWVQCNKPDCWVGPVGNRRDKAIEVWRKCMGRHKDS